MEFTPRNALPLAGWRGWGKNRMQVSHHLRGRGFLKLDCLTPDVDSATSLFYSGLTPRG